MPPLTKAFFNGKIIPYQDAKIHANAAVFKYATAVFEGIRAYWNSDESKLYVFKLVEHSDRLVKSVALMRMKSAFDSAYYQDGVMSLLRDIKPVTDLHIRQTVWVDNDGSMWADSPVGCVVIATPSGRPAGYDAGISMQVSSWTRINDQIMPARIKCIANYHNGRLASMQARQDGYDNALLLNSRGKVAEAPGACFFLVKNGVPVTPTVTSDILESINRATIIHLFKEQFGLDVEVRDVDRTEVYMADEAFLCGTAAEVTPVASVDRFPMKKGRGDLTRALQEKWEAITTGKDKAHPEWRTLV
ncbi:MAG: aminotransferase class IV [Bacillota bacterium]|nr:aminotransferase class IV [Bacillota bacterium]